METAPPGVSNVNHGEEKGRWWVMVARKKGPGGMAYFKHPQLASALADWVGCEAASVSTVLSTDRPWHPRAGRLVQRPHGPGGAWQGYTYTLNSQGAGDPSYSP